MPYCVYLVSSLTLKCLPHGTAVWNEWPAHLTQYFLPKASRAWRALSEAEQTLLVLKVSV